MKRFERVMKALGKPPHAIPSDVPPPTTPFQASNYASDEKHHLLIAATGSVASIKIPLILRSLSTYKNLSIRLIFTTPSLLFLPPLQQLLEITNVDGVHLDHHEWPLNTADGEQIQRPEGDGSLWSKVGDPILHIELRRWADILLIAPLTANTLAKLSIGMCDNLLLSVCRAWDPTPTPSPPPPYTSSSTHAFSSQRERKRMIVVAPAMNTLMFNHPVTATQLNTLEEWGFYKVLTPVEKVLACGDTGSGAMKEWGEIVQWVVEELGLGDKKSGEQTKREILKQIDE